MVISICCGVVNRFRIGLWILFWAGAGVTSGFLGWLSELCLVTGFFGGWLEFCQGPGLLLGWWLLVLWVVSVWLWVLVYSRRTIILLGFVSEKQVSIDWY